MQNYGHNRGVTEGVPTCFNFMFYLLLKNTSSGSMTRCAASCAHNSQKLSWGLAIRWIEYCIMECAFHSECVNKGVFLRCCHNQVRLHGDIYLKCPLEVLSKQPDRLTREEWLSHSQSPGLFHLPPGVGGGAVGWAPVIVKVAVSLPRLKWPRR